ncbi:MAG: RNA polymerase factor sigma-54 [Bacteroidia bacterium]|nr:RNA polymerase factor sigma-54 [Bacteroidia bacterium]MCZ2277956.1 RNA polymerase factor sigma-54 [Bacteroidia bacterium]
MLKQTLQQKLLQKLSPQQIQMMKLLQVPAALLDQRIKEELEANPVLEEGRDDEEEEMEQEEGQDEFPDDAAFEVNAEDEATLDEHPAQELEFQQDHREERSAEEQLKEDFDVADYMTDEDVPYYKVSNNNSSVDDEQYEAPVVSTISFQESLITQLGEQSLDDRQYQIAMQLIGSIDEDGLLRRNLTNIIDDLAFSQNITTSEDELLNVLKVIQTFDPAGVGARDLQECLLLQLNRKEQTPAIRLAYKAIDRFMEEFSKKHYEKIALSLSITDEEMKDVLQEIMKLNPKPGSTFIAGSRSSEAVIPDFILTNDEGKLELSLNSKNAPDLKLNKTYLNMLQEYSKNKNKNKSQREALSFVRQKLDAAKWFIDAIKQRQHTLLHVMNTILEFQKEYFMEGDETKLKPMILKDIADIVGMDISTISRVANSKYIQTHFGTFLLKTFFSESMTTDSGEEVSSREVKKILTDAVNEENKRKPLTDDQLAKLLKEKGYNIARRTVAKYREQLNIPVARLRKGL